MLKIKRILSSAAVLLSLTMLSSCGRVRNTNTEVIPSLPSGESTVATVTPVTSDSSPLPTESESLLPTSTPTPIPTPTPTPTPQNKVVRFLAAGDNIIHEAVYTDAMTLAGVQSGIDGYSEKYYFDPMYADVADLIDSADLSFVNHECPVAGDEEGVKGYPRFNSPLQSVLTLKRLGFDVINVSNNHMLDMERYCTGYKNTVENVKSMGVTLIGGYTKEDYDALRIVEKNGIRIAFLSYVTYLNHEEVHKDSPEMVIPLAEDAVIRRQTALAREKADFLVVSMHWGTENSEKVDSEQKRLGKLLCACGVDVILGHHSHTIQPVEWISEGEHKTLCYYSLGNFISTQHPIRNLTGIFASFNFVITPDGEKMIEEVAAIPHMTWYSTQRDTVRIYLLEHVTEELIKTHGSQLRVDDNGGKFTLEDVKKFAAVSTVTTVALP